MTVSNAAGSGGRKKRGRGKGSPGTLRFRMSLLKEVLKRRNQVGTLIKQRLEANMLKEETKLEGQFHKMKLDKEVKKLKKEIQELLKKAGENLGEIPEVKVRLQVIYPKRAESILLKGKDVKAENLKKLGVPGAGSLEKAVTHVQSQIDEVRDQQSVMRDEVEKMIKTIKALDQ